MMKASPTPKNIVSAFAQHLQTRQTLPLASRFENCQRGNNRNENSGE